MTPETVLLDRSFLGALLDRDHPVHADVVERYRGLLDRYESNEIRLRARHDHLDEHDERGVTNDLLAPVERIHVAAQFRRQARRLDLPFEVDEDTATTLVVMRRESIRRIATLERMYEQVAVEID